MTTSPRLDDAILSEDGLAARPGDGKGKDAEILLIACGALAREILAIIKLNGWDHVGLACLPAKLHNRPDRIPDAVRERIKKARGDGIERIFLVYADCGTGGLLDKLCEEEGVTRIEGPHCYSFFSGNAEFSDRADAGEITTFYLTDFLTRQFDTLIWKGMGLDRHPDLRDMIFGNYEKVVYLAQAPDQTLDRKAEEAARRLGLSYERRETGYGDLTAFMENAAAAPAGAAVNS